MSSVDANKNKKEGPGRAFANAIGMCFLAAALVLPALALYDVVPAGVPLGVLIASAAAGVTHVIVGDLHRKGRLTTKKDEAEVIDATLDVLTWFALPVGVPVMVAVGTLAAIVYVAARGVGIVARAAQRGFTYPD